MRGQQGTFSLEETLWTRILARSNSINLKRLYYGFVFLQTCSFSLHNKLTDGLEWCGLLVDYCDVLISYSDSHSDGTHSLQRMKKQNHLHLGWSEGEQFSANFIFG